jgi:hypothetical protein
MVGVAVARHADRIVRAAVTGNPREFARHLARLRDSGGRLSDPFLDGSRVASLLLQWRPPIGG